MADNDGGISSSAENKGKHTKMNESNIFDYTTDELGPGFREPWRSTSTPDPDMFSELCRETLRRACAAIAYCRENGYTHETSGAAPVDVNHRQSRPSSVNKGGRERPKSLGHTLHWFAYVGQEPDYETDYFCGYDEDSAGAGGTTAAGDHGQEYDDSGEAGSRGDGASSAASREREERARLVRERQNSERARKLEELRSQALAAQRFREQKEEERRKRIDEMRTRDNDRRHQVEERKRAIWEAERERREAIVRRNEEREARLEVRRKSGAAGVFAFGSSTPRMLEPADTGGTFWGHRRATSTSNVMFAALPLSRRSSERELDPNKKRATSASGLDRQPGDDYRVSSTMYEVFHWAEYGASDSSGNGRQIFPQQLGYHEEGSGDNGAPWSRVARRKTDLVPTIPLSAGRQDGHRGTPRSPGRAYSMTRLDQLSRPRRVPQAPASPDSQAPARPPRHRSAGQLSRAPAHRSVGNLTTALSYQQGPPPPPPPRRHTKQTVPASGLRSGEITPSSPSRPGSSLSSASMTGSAATSTSVMTSSVTGALVNRRPRAAPRRPRPASIAGTGVTTPPHVKTNTVGADGKPVGVRAEKPPLPRVHSAGSGKKVPQPPTPTSDKPEVPKRAHKGGAVKSSPRLTPRTTPLQSPATELPPVALEDVQESVTVEQFQDGNVETTIVTQTQTAEISDGQTDISEASVSTITETVKQVTKDENGQMETEVKTTTTTTVEDNGNVEVNKTVVETVTVKEDDSMHSQIVVEPLVEEIEKMSVKEETPEPTAKVESKQQEANLGADLLENTDMTASMSARSRGVITTEVEAKAALAERRRLAREEAERQAEKERLRLEKEAEEEEERQRQEEERQRKLEEETIRLSELQRRAEEERLQQAIQEAQRRVEEENLKREQEVKARAEREAAEARAREEAERVRKETVERLRREEEEREARRKRVEAIMLRTRQAKQKKDGDKSPTEENKSLEDVEQKSIENKLATEEIVKQQEILSSEKNSTQQLDSTSAYELSVREREEALFNHNAPHNQATMVPLKQEAESNGLNSTFQNGTSKPSNGDAAKDHLQNESNAFAVQNGHSKNQLNEMNNFINTSDSQYISVAVDNTVIQNNVTNNLLDLGDVDLLNTTNKNNPFMVDINTNGSSTQLHSQQIEGSNRDIGQLLDFSVETVSKNLVNEDSINSNQTTNSPFITSFQDNQENRDLSLL